MRLAVTPPTALLLGYGPGPRQEFGMTPPTKGPRDGAPMGTPIGVVLGRVARELHTVSVVLHFDKAHGGRYVIATTGGTVTVGETATRVVVVVVVICWSWELQLETATRTAGCYHHRRRGGSSAGRFWGVVRWVLDCGR